MKINSDPLVKMSAPQQVNVAPNPSDSLFGLVPVGSVVQWTTPTAPAGWLICDGSAVSRSTYASLFSVIGTTYGSNGGSGTQLATSWVSTGSALTITFTSPQSNTNIIGGSLFDFTDGHGNTYKNLSASYGASGSIAVAPCTIPAGSGNGGSVSFASGTTFNLPNCKSSTIRSYDGTTYTIGAVGGADSYALTPSNIASHKHDLTMVANGVGSASGSISTSTPPASAYITGLNNYAVGGGGIYPNSTTNGIGPVTPLVAAGSNGASFSLVNQYIVLSYIIKY